MGFPNIKKSGTYWTFSKILGESIKLSALFDRDYRCQEEVESFIKELEKEADFVHVLSKKEIENFLLVPKALEKTILGKFEKGISEANRKKYSDFDIKKLIDEVSEESRY
jgi:hypothetical protein